MTRFSTDQTNVNIGPASDGNLSDSASDQSLHPGMRPTSGANQVSPNDDFSWQQPSEFSGLGRYPGGTDAGPANSASLIQLQQHFHQTIQQATTEFTAVQQALETAGTLDKSALQTKLQQSVERIQSASQGVNHLSSVLQHNLMAIRQEATAIAHSIRQATSLEDAFQIAVTRVQNSLQADRALLYRFAAGNQGVVLAEAVGSNWTPTLGETLPALCFGRDQAAHYGSEQAIAFTDVSKVNPSPYWKQLLEKFQITASLALPLWVDGQLWGLLVVQQCHQPRSWQEVEISLLTQVATALILALQPVEFRRQQQQWAAQEEVLAHAMTRIQQSLDVETIFRTTTQEVRRLLKCDRVGIYRFDADWSGEFVAESVASGWTPLLNQRDRGTLDRNTSNRCAMKTFVFNYPHQDDYLRETQAGTTQQRDSFVVNDLLNSGLDECYVEILQQYEVRAYAIVPIKQRQKVWGLLAVYQNSGPRQWQPSEVSIVTRIADQLGIAIQQAEQARELTRVAEQEQTFNRVIAKIRQVSDLESIFNTTTQEVRRLFNLERVTIYKFREDFFGDFVTESEAGGWRKLVGSGWEDPYLNEHQGGCFRQNEPFVVDDIQTGITVWEDDGFNLQKPKRPLTDCHIEALEYYEVQACAVVAIFQGQKLWGLLSAFQNTGPRRWQESEVKLMMRIAEQLGVGIQQAEQAAQLAQVAEQEKAFNRVITKIRQVSDLESIFSTTTQEVRRLFNLERVTIYKFREDFFGDFVTESEAGGWRKLVGSAWEDPYLNEHQGGCFRQNEPFVVDDIQTGMTIWEEGRLNLQKPRQPLTDCHIEALEYYEVQACAVVAIFQGQKLWGLLSAFQNTGPRRWQESEVKLMMRIAEQLGVAIQQAEYLSQLQNQTVELTKAADRQRNFLRIIDRVGQSLIDKIRLSKDVETIFGGTTQQLRQLLQVDRVAIYRFEPDWGGKFIAESVAPGWTRLVDSGVQTVWDDTHLQETEGGRYRSHESFAVDDVYLADHSPCHLEILEQYEVKAYLIVPIFAGEQLWGLLGAYQNSHPRHWEDTEISLLSQVGAQLGVALQQASYLEQVQLKSQQLAEIAERERVAKENLQQDVVHLLSSVQSVLKGDLTVRAPVTDNEVGTVAAAYNNTLQTLRRIVLHVQASADNVEQTSQGSRTAIAQLSQQTQQAVKELAQALEQVQAMAQVTQTVADNAKRVETAVQQSNDIVQQGDTAMNLTVEGIEAIRATVSETTQKIKRLSESSQKISKVVNLIHNFTNQTQLLALNAAIEATRAGEYGKGFTVVADEIRSLAQQSAEATTDIEKLVQEIQTETTSVATAMDLGIEQVVGGTSRVNEARQTLTAIVTATAQIWELVQNITQSTQSQAQQSESVTQTMNHVVALANDTFDESRQISASFQQLLDTAEALQASVNQFKVN